MRLAWEVGAGLVAFAAGLLALRITRERASLPSGAPGPGSRRPVDPYAAWDTTKEGQCDPAPKPGVLLFRQWVLGRWGERAGSPENIVRDCKIGSASEHHEGRAWDLMVRSHEHGQEIVDALMAPEGAEAHALARRAGIMYLIWAHKMWRAYPWQGRPAGDWQPYALGEAASPHVDHVHFSFSRDGAAGKTSLYDMIRANLPAA